MARVVKIDSNITGARYAEEVSLGVLDNTPANQTWYELEPNAYPEFGGEVETVARTPINPGRQRKKGSVVNVSASAALETDVTLRNTQRLMQGFMYADTREKAKFTGVAITVQGPANNDYGATGIHDDFFAGDLILASGFALPANNGVKIVATAATNTVGVTTALEAETSPATAKLEAVGFQFGSGEVEIVAAGGAFPYLERTGGTKDLTQLGLLPGEWIYIGGDTSVTQFAQANNNGFARVRSVTTTRITFDKTSAAMVTDDGAAKTIRVFKGDVLKNEIGTLIKRRSLTIERTLGASDDDDLTLEQAEYVRGAVPNVFNLQANSADKLTAELSFVGLESFAIDENVSGADSLLSKISGVVRVPVEEADAFNTSSDFQRIRISTVSATSAFTDPLFTYAEEFNLEINNNNEPNNAIGVLGAFEVTAGTFEVGGEITAYFGDVAAIQAVQNNADVSLDFILVRENAGIAVDLPLLTLGNGRLDVELNQAIKIPLDTEAASGAKVHPTLNHTLLWVYFPYLPNAAAN